MGNILKTIMQQASLSREWAENARPDVSETLCGMCAIASADVFRRLKVAGFKPEIWFKPDHSFVHVKGYIVDVTATQFDSRYDKVIVIPIEQAMLDSLWSDGIGDEDCIEFRAKTLRAAAVFQEESDWPEHQRITARN
jgi:hypothetical protein